MIRFIKSKPATARPAEPVADPPEELAGLVSLRAENFFTAHGLSCSESVLLVINRGFGGGLPPETCLGLGSGFGGGIGNSGSVCGALSGAVMALGLFLGHGRGGMSAKNYRALVGGLHDRLRARSGAVCCRELIADFRGRRTRRKEFCSGLTGWLAGETARLILAARPELALSADRQFLAGKESRLVALVARLTGNGVAAGKGLTDRLEK